ncbi:LmbE-like protein [Rubellimicrobium mesophilum DSM 19309]|uniref:LmbE-like protein n=1 Tax=Rubellimicrobium mesophilum DSM 19309 TaxID=442562 RepID=A0A017HR49_9RHOB|nr:PIG-L family deacetylase [Rubellimicrobium mesophilum]EYD76962.1 LmbE-like protein [Rubellimicrobium mesophilum DSM 19309]
MSGFLQRLARHETIPERVVVVVAHPDDEVLAAGSRMDRMEDLTVIHITDGSPRDMQDARREGLTREDYAALRRREVAAAMDALDADPELLCYWHPDKESILHGPAILDQLTEDLRGAAFVITHAYEHGHPDHDTAALCTHLALDRLREGAKRPRSTSSRSTRWRTASPSSAASPPMPPRPRPCCP